MIASIRIKWRSRPAYLIKGAYNKADITVGGIDSFMSRMWIDVEFLALEERYNGGQWIESIEFEHKEEE